MGSRAVLLLCALACLASCVAAKPGLAFTTALLKIPRLPTPVMMPAGTLPAAIQDMDRIQRSMQTAVQIQQNMLQVQDKIDKENQRLQSLLSDKKAQDLFCGKQANNQTAFAICVRQTVLQQSAFVDGFSYVLTPMLDMTRQFNMDALTMFAQPKLVGEFCNITAKMATSVTMRRASNPRSIVWPGMTFKLADLRSGKVRTSNWWPLPKNATIPRLPTPCT